MIPVEEHSPNRNLSLNLNNITNTNNGNNHSSSDMSNATTTIITINNLHQDNVNDLCDEDLIDENTKLLSYEKKQAMNGDAMKPNLNHHQKNQKNKIIVKNVNTSNCDDDEIQKNGHVVTTSAIKSDNNVEFLGNKLKSLKKNMEEQKQQQQQEQSQKDQTTQQNQQKKVTLKR